MMSVATPPHTPRSQHVFNIPSFSRRQNEQDEARRPSDRQQRLQQAEEASFARARSYVDDFLTRSEWGEQKDNISVIWDDVPTMEELESYGFLDAAEGTRACRKLFKAPVVWDDLGHGLWQRLRKAAEQKKAALKGLGPMLRMGVVGNELPTTPPPTREQPEPEYHNHLLPHLQHHQHHNHSQPHLGMGLGRRVSNDSNASGKSRSSSRSSASSSLPKIIRTIIRKNS